MTNRAASVQNTVRYLRRMAEIRAIATPETSYYSPLEELLNAIGGDLRPKVCAVGQLHDIGFGFPDFGLFTAAQLKRAKKESRGEKPERGVVEVKSLSASLSDLLRDGQVEKYARGYGLVLATNYREFALAEWADDKVLEIDRRTLAASADEFWEMAKHPQKTADEFGDTICEFLRRALIRKAPISTAKDLAGVLASFARESLGLLENRVDETALKSLREALENALSMKFEGDKGAHFFCSTLAQTIFYGLFSAWMQLPADKIFDWEKAGRLLKSPVMRALFGEISNPDRLGRLGLEKLLDGATDALNRVREKESLFGGMDSSAAVQHFYEPFLADFDPGLRKELGVWYTPPEIVRYMVARADRVLREELNIPDGLAGDNVYVLDPCGGTGAYIVETLKRIHRTCKKRGDGDNAARLVKTAAMNRIFGFEILSASYVVAHWQIGALLQQLGAPLNDDERAAVYLTNSLTDWTEKEQPPFLISGLEEEYNAANKIKREQPILVIMGNPPYNAFAGTSPEEEDGLVEPYKKGLREWGINSGNLNDLYVRFFRMAENRIGKTGRGIVSFISNYSYTEEPLFTVMRQSLLKNFDKAWIENMHGDRNKTERAPDGNSSNTIFAMRGFSPGIRQGVVVALFAKTGDSESPATVQYRDDINTAKADERRAQLLASLDAENFNSQYEIANPQPWNKFSFRPVNANDDFMRWTPVDEFCKFHSNGTKEGRGGAMIDIDCDSLERRMRDYFNPEIDWETYKQAGGGLAKNAPLFDAKESRAKMIVKQFNPENIAPCVMRPFDDAFCYYPDTPRMWNAARPELWKQFKGGNSFFVSRPKSTVTPEGAPAFFTNLFGNRGAMSDPRYIPFHLHSDESVLEKTENKTTANLSQKARDYLRRLKFADPDSDNESAEVIWLHSLAVCYSPEYQTENADGLKIGYPRIPLPKKRATLESSAKIGVKIRDLLNMQIPLSQTAAASLSTLATPAGDMQNLSAADWWGYKDGKGKTYPGRGKTAAGELTPDYESFAKKLGAPLDVFLNETAKWENIPTRAWQYRIGGFQPPKKWLSYRAKKVLGRPLRPEEIRQFSDIIRRISGLVLLETELDGNYRAVKNSSG